MISEKDFKLIVNKRIREELHPEDCVYCGGIHSLRCIGTAIQCDSLCCKDLVRDANRIMREEMERYDVKECD